MVVVCACVWALGFMLLFRMLVSVVWVVTRARLTCLLIGAWHFDPGSPRTVFNRLVTRARASRR